MNRLGRRPAGGFTLIELLIVVAIIGIIAAILIPNLLDAMQKAKQKRTLAEIRNTGTAWMAWLTDQASAAAAGGLNTTTLDWSSFSALGHEGLTSLLVPAYTNEVQEVDAWRHAYDYGLSGNLESTLPMGIRSTGNDGQFEGNVYQFTPFIATDYTRDIVWSGGFFISWPSGIE